MKTRNFLLVAAAGMTLAASVMADDADRGMWNDLLARQQAAFRETAPASQVSQPDRIGRTSQAFTGADFDRETQAISRSLERGNQAIGTDAAALGRDAGVAGSAGVVMEPDGQVRDTGSAQFDGYVEQVNRRLQLDAPAFEFE